jgi:hypothetical protein
LLIKEAKKDGWIMDQKCDSFFWLIKQAKKVFLDPKCDASAEDYEKREDLDEIWPKMSLIFC